MLAILCCLNSLFAADHKKVAEIEIKGNERISEKYILRNIKTRKEGLFTPKVWNEDLRRLYETGLFNDVKTEIVKQDADHVWLRVDVSERIIVSDVLYKGNRRYKDRELREKLYLKPGMALEKGRVNLDIVTIKDLYREKSYLFTTVEPEVVEDEPGRVILIYNITEDTKTLVGGIALKGNDNIPDKELLKIMETKVDRWYNSAKFLKEEFQMDLGRIKSYYMDKGYLDVQVSSREPTFNDDRDRIYLTVTIRENHRYEVSSVTITGRTAYAEETLLEKTELRAGNFFSLGQMYRDSAAIEKYYKSDGRIFTKVNPLAVPDRDTNTITIEYKIREGKEVMIREIRVKGNKKTRDIVIRRELEFFPGEKFDYSKIEESMANLKRLAFFEKVDIKEIPSGLPGMADVEIAVVEQPTGQINMGVGFSTIETIMGSFSIQQRNFDIKDKPDSLKDFFTGSGFVGDGQSITLRARAGTRSQSYSLSFMEPWLFNKRIWFGFDLYKTMSEYTQYDESRTGGNLKLGRELVKDLSLTGIYSWEMIDIDDVSSFSSPLIREEEGRSIISSVTASLTYDKRDSRFFATKGWFMNLSEKVAGGPFGGTENFFKTSGDLQGYFTLADIEKWGKHVISARVRATHVKEFADSKRVPVFERLFAGGLNSVRGFEYRELGPEDQGTKVGGNFRLLGTAEYSMPIYQDKFRIGFFSDAGYVWNRIQDYDSDDYRVSIGVSLKVKLPISPIPISFDWARPVRRKDQDDIQIFTFNFGSIFF